MTTKTYVVTEVTVQFQQGQNLMTLTSPELDLDEVAPGTIINVTCQNLGIYEKPFFAWWGSQYDPNSRLFAEVEPSA